MDPGQASRSGSVLLVLIAFVLAGRAAIRLTHHWSVGGLILHTGAVLIPVALAVVVWRPRRW
jgi:hypothetical protein